MSRISRDQYFIEMAEHVAKRSTCLRRAVGCVIVDGFNHVVATGYCGAPRGFDHCIDIGKCLREEVPIGTSLDHCVSTHAEMNALMQCQDVQNIMTIYCTTEPCNTCTKLILSTGCSRVVFINPYPQTLSKILWTSMRAPEHWVHWQKRKND